VYSLEGFVQGVASWGFFPSPECRSQRCKIFVQRSAKVSENPVCYSLINLNTASRINITANQICHLPLTYS
jgi:hypothetical protein